VGPSTVEVGVSLVEARASPVEVGPSLGVGAVEDGAGPAGMLGPQGGRLLGAKGSMVMGSKGGLWGWGDLREWAFGDFGDPSLASSFRAADVAAR
jgi:hypothetical protein